MQGLIGFVVAFVFSTNQTHAQYLTSTPQPEERPVASTSALQEVASSSSSRPCKSASSGTLTSAICFIVERFTTDSPTGEIKVKNVDEKNCTFTTTEKKTVYLKKVNYKEIQYSKTPHNLCYKMTGKNIGSSQYGESDLFFVCGSKTIDKSRLDKAFSAIFLKYCKGKKEEF
jgi:hypothetical protein